jgi:hypothetical protein
VEGEVTMLDLLQLPVSVGVDQGGYSLGQTRGKKKN